MQECLYSLNKLRENTKRRVLPNIRLHELGHSCNPSIINQQLISTHQEAINRPKLVKFLPSEPQSLLPPPLPLLLEIHFGMNTTALQNVTMLSYQWLGKNKCLFGRMILKYTSETPQIPELAHELQFLMYQKRINIK